MKTKKNNSDLGLEQDAEALESEFQAMQAGGRGGAARAGACALLAVLVIIAGVFQYHFGAGGSDAFLNRLDSELLGQAQLSLDSSSQTAGRMAVVPSWPLRLYAALRRDIAVYACFGLLAAWLWARSAAMRARRDAWLVHDRLTREMDQLRRRLDKISGSGTISQEHGPDGSAAQKPVD